MYRNVKEKSCRTSSATPHLERVTRLELAITPHENSVFAGDPYLRFEYGGGSSFSPSQKEKELPNFFSNSPSGAGYEARTRYHTPRKLRFRWGPLPPI